MTSEQTTADDQTNALVMKDTAGRYYVLPSAVLEVARVPEEAAAVERFLAEADDVQGHRDQGDTLVSALLVLRYGNDGTAGSIGAMAAGVGKALGDYSRSIGRLPPGRPA